MLVHGESSDGQLGDGATSSNLLREGWGLTGVSLLQRLQTYPTRYVGRIVCDQGCFAVKVDADPGPGVEGSQHVQLAVARALAHHVPAIVPDLSGAPYVVDKDGRRLTVFEDIRGGQPTSSAPTWHRLGAILAQMHALPTVSKDFAIPVQAAANELDQQASDYPFAEDLRSLTHRVRRISDQPAATIHGEVNLSNVRQRPDGDLVLLDWDAAGTGPIALDLGYPLICVFHDEDLTWHPDRAAAFYAGYAENSTGTIPSPEQIFDAALMHALHYLRFANTAQRWARARYAINQEARLLEFLARTIGQH
ncbi:phosphotransferase enzyme family protein [Actinopolymorpha pittospori]|nr:phosphotransferase [Actinopolymorpha pittospori]